MEKEVLEIESDPRGGYERFTNSSVTITDEIVVLCRGALDRRGKNVVRQFVKGPHEAVRGIARIAWKSPEHREKCIQYQKSRSRWAKVEEYADLMREEKWDYSRPGPIFIHPGLTDSAAHQLKPVNGARRIMAYLEVHHDPVDVIVLRPIGGEGKGS